MDTDYHRWARNGIVDVWPLKCRVRLSSEEEWRRFVAVMVALRDMGELETLTPVKLSDMGFQVLTER